MSGLRHSVSGIRQRAGTLVFDKPRFAGMLHGKPVEGSPDASWIGFHNRGERLIPSPDGPGFDCDWQWTSDLNICRVFPGIGRRLMAAALAHWPIDIAEHKPRQQTSDVEVSFIIGHRGAEKVPHLISTVQSVLSQKSVSIECLVVEQATDPLLSGILPEGVRYLHTPPPAADMAYARAWAFNVGARHARGKILVFHDNDILCPAGYAAELVGLMARGSQAARLQRFVFYLTEPDTAKLLAGGGLTGCAPLHVRQNCEGHTLAVERDAYFALGGHDESFVGWGGEDNEMFNRCRSICCYPYGYLPFVHLHHTPQPRPADPERFMKHLNERLAMPVEKRIAELTAKPFGVLSGTRPK